MNCFCNPPKPADVRKVSKAGENQGRDFFTCRESKCDFFHWVGAPLPPSYIQRQTNAMHSATKKDAGIPVKITLARFDIGPPHNIWFSVNCPTTPVLTKYYTSIDEKFRDYSPTLKIWLFSFLVYNDVVSKLQSNDLGTYDVAELPRFLVNGLKKFVSGLPTLSADPVLNLEATLMENLMPFQLDGIQFVVKRGGRALIGDEMGCGKTLQAIGVLQHYHKKWPALVLMPPILLQQWRDELLKFSQELLKDSDIVTLKKTSDKIDGRFKVLLVPYSIMDKLVETGKINPQMFGVVIADESHNLKSIGAQRTTAAIPFLQKASVAVCLSGTPATNRPIELFTQLSGLLPNVFTDYDAFGKRYCDPKPSKFANTTEYKGSCNESELKMVLEGMVMIRRLKEDVVKSLPNKCRELRYVDPDPQHLPQLKAIQKKSAMLESDMRNAASADKVKMANEQRILLLEHFKVTGLCKIRAITEELARLVDEARYERALAESNAGGTSAASAVPFRAHDDEAVVDFNGEFELVDHISNGQAVAQRKAFESPEECKALTQSVLDDETVVLEPPGRASRTGSISSREEEDAEFEVVRRKPNRNVSSSSSAGGLPRDSKRRRLQIHDDDDDDDGEEEWDEPKVRQDSGNSSDYEWEEDVPDYEFNGDHWTQANISPVRIKRKRSLPPPPSGVGSSSASAAKKGKPPVSKNVFDEMKSAAAANRNPSPIAASKVRPSSSSGSKSSASASTPKKGSTSVSGLGKKIIVFAHHLDVMDAIQQRLEDLEVEFIRIDGGVTGPQRNQLIKKFQEDDVTDVALLSVTACGTGLNLTRANVAVFGELYWSPGVVLQAEDRIHRLGQKSASIRIIYMLGRNTADDIVWDQIQRKHHVLGATVGIADHKSTNGGGMAIGKGAVQKSGRYGNNGGSNYGNSGSSSSSAAVPAAPPVNPYHRDNPYSGANPYANNGAANIDHAGNSSSSNSSYSYAAQPAPANASAVPAPTVPVSDFFKPRTTSRAAASSPDSNRAAAAAAAAAAALALIPEAFQYGDSPMKGNAAPRAAAPGLTFPAGAAISGAVPSATELTAEQRERVERNRKAALEKLALKKQAEEQQRLLSSSLAAYGNSIVVVPSAPAALPAPSVATHAHTGFGAPVVVACSATAAVAGAGSTHVVSVGLPKPSFAPPAASGSATGPFGSASVRPPMSNGHIPYPPASTVVTGSGADFRPPTAAPATNPYSIVQPAFSSNNGLDTSVYGSTRVVSNPPPITSIAGADKYGTPHVFSTSRGSTITTSAQGMQKANQIFGSNGNL